MSFRQNCLLVKYFINHWSDFNATLDVHLQMTDLFYLRCVKTCRQHKTSPFYILFWNPNALSLVFLWNRWRFGFRTDGWSGSGWRVDSRPRLTTWKTTTWTQPLRPALNERCPHWRKFKKKKVSSGQLDHNNVFVESWQKKPVVETFEMIFFLSFFM